MEGCALQWFQWASYNSQFRTWSEFVRVVERCFGLSKFDDPQGALAKLVQRTTVEAYQSEFEMLQNRTTCLSSSFLTSCFIERLTPELRVEVLALRPISLPQAISLARLQEAKIVACASTQRTSTFCFAPPSISPSPLWASLPPSTSEKRVNTPSTPASPYMIPKISSVEMQTRRGKGLCYYCVVKYSFGHRCSSKPQIFFLDVDTESDFSKESIEAVVEQPQIEDHLNAIENSLHTLFGISSPSQFRFSGCLAGYSVQVLVDSGSSLNFI